MSEKGKRELIEPNPGDKRFARRNDPLAWSPRGTIADVPGRRRGLRIWRDPTPDRAPAFLRWLHETTDAEVDSASIR